MARLCQRKPWRNQPSRNPWLDRASWWSWYQSNLVGEFNENVSPFRDNGQNDTHVGFLQGAAFLEQEISGFAVGQEYVLSLDFNSRNCCGDFPIGTVLLDGEVVASSMDLPFPGGGIVPVGGEEPWYHADVPFVAGEESITLRIESMAAAGGDATMLVDNVSIVPEPATGLMALLGVIGLAAIRRRR